METVTRRYQLELATIGTDPQLYFEPWKGYVRQRAYKKTKKHIHLDKIRFQHIPINLDAAANRPWNGWRQEPVRQPVAVLVEPKILLLFDPLLLSYQPLAFDIIFIVWKTVNDLPRAPGTLCSMALAAGSVFPHHQSHDRLGTYAGNEPLRWAGGHRIRRSRCTG